MNNHIGLILYSSCPTQMMRANAAKMPLPARVSSLSLLKWRWPIYCGADKSVHGPLFSVKCHYAITALASAVWPYQAIIALVMQNELVKEFYQIALWRASALRVSIPSPFSVMGIAPPSRFDPLAASINRTHSGISHLSLQRFGWSGSAGVTSTASGPL